MTERRKDKDRDCTTRASKLEALYSRAGDVEPDSGLDRIVRARADEAIGGARSPGQIPWLGGLVTASVAVVAIALVLQQTPPGKPLSESLAPRDSAEADAYMAPSLGAQSQGKAPTGADRPARQILEENKASLRADGEPAGEMPPRPASESRQRRAVPAEAEPAAAPTLDEPALDRIVVTGARIISADDAELESADAVIERLRKLIEADRIDEARRMLDEAVGRHPELDLPEDLARTLEKR